MDWQFLLVEFLLFIAIGWLVFLALLFYWLVSRLHDPEYFNEYLPWMQKHGFV